MFENIYTEIIKFNELKREISFFHQKDQTFITFKIQQQLRNIIIKQSMEILETQSDSKLKWQIQAKKSISKSTYKALHARYF